MTNTTDLVDRYVHRAAADDIESYLALFAPDALVEDDGHSYRGADAIRAWRTGGTPVHYDVRHTMTTAVTTTALVEVSGDFAGSPVGLIFAFGVDGRGRIERLTIRPEVTR